MSAVDPDALRRHLKHLTVLHEVSTRVVATLDPEEVVAGVLASIGDLFAYQSAVLYQADLGVASPAGALPRLRARRAVGQRGQPAAEDLDVDVDSLVADAMREQCTVCRTLPSGLVLLVMPLAAGGRLLGGLEVTLDGPLGLDDVKVLELLAGTAAVALQNAHLHQETQRLATTDPLTGLSNYRHFHELLALEVQRARRMRYTLGMLLIDLDHFKLVNDRHGHPAGDRALQQIAELMRTRLRRTDIVARVGGEEFAVILPGDGPNQVSIVAEKLRSAIEALPPVSGGMTSDVSPLTLSVGATWLEPDALDAEVLIACADRALYEAKRNGRNQVRLWRCSAGA